jgi:hypothetical protein
MRPMSTSPPRPRRSLRRRLLLLASSLLVALLLGEFAARWIVEGSFLEAVDSVLGLRTAEVPGRDNGVVHDDELGFRLSPHLPGVNSRGVRHPEFTQPKPPGRCRVLLLGDSVGWPLDGFFRDVEAEVRRRSPRDFEFVNACVHGYTTYQERRFFERELQDLQWDVVVLQYCINDNHRFLHRLTTGGRRLLTPEARNLLFPEGDGAWPWLARSSYLLYLVRRAWLGSATAGERVWEGTGRTAWQDESWAELAGHVAAIAAQVRERGGELVVVAVPHEDQLRPEELGVTPEFAGVPQRQLAAVCEREQVPCLDLHPVLLAHRDEGMFTDQLHLSPVGHRLAGRALADFLLARTRLAGR